MSEQPPQAVHGVARRLRRAAAVAALLALALLLAGALALTGAAAWLDAPLHDAQVRVLRSLADPAAARFEAEVVVVGIDAASLESIPEPQALMHELLGAALEGLAAGGARLVAIDAVLPSRSYDGVRPGLDRALIRGLVALREAAGVVFVLEPDVAGRVRLPFAPLAAAAGHRDDRPALGVALYPVDADNVIRRFDPALASDGRSSFVGVIAQRLGIAERAGRGGWIDFARGAPFTYVPLAEVAAWQRQGDRAELRRRFADRVVLVGSVLPYEDRHHQPLNLVAWEYPATAAPGVLLHAQSLRTLLGAGFITPAPVTAGVLLTVALAASLLLRALAWRWLLWLAGLGLAAALATLLHWRGLHLPLAAAALGSLGAVGLRTALDVVEARRQRRRLAHTFGGYVSPQLLRAILAGRADARQGRRAMAFLFADLRGFTAWSERTGPEQVLALLNRYYAAVTPVIHAQGGTIDNFRGDGVMVMFGAPLPHADPCGAAFAAAQGIIAAVAALNRDRAGAAADGIDLEVAIGLAFGDAVFGDLGSDDRKDFTALGDAVNVAARLQDLAKGLGYPVLATETLRACLPPHTAALLTPLGEVPLKNHSPVAVAGWRP